MLIPHISKKANQAFFYPGGNICRVQQYLGTVYLNGHGISIFHTSRRIAVWLKQFKSVDI
jgi:hypothetical protein